MNFFVYRIHLLLAVYFSCFTTGLTAQLATQDSIFYKHVINRAAIDYQQMMGDNSRIFNGAQYSGYPFKFFSGHQFFDSIAVMEGTVVYDNILYQGLKLQYDEITDVVILHNKFRKIQLSGERISHFTIKDNRFARIEKSSSGKSPINKEGFYQVLYEGNVHVYKKEVKEVFDELTSDQGILRRILAKQNYFVKKGNDYLPINKKGDLIEAYKDKKKEIREYISKNKLNKREERERMIVQVSAYYDQITK